MSGITDLESIDFDLQAAKLGSFWESKKKIISGLLVVIIVVPILYYGYNEFIKKPNEEKAADAIYKAQEFYGQDSCRKALEGDGTNKGFLYVIKTYGSTNSGNLANYYAGVCYLKLGEFSKAVEYLKSFNCPSKHVQMLAYGNLADAYSELGQKEDAITYYAKAGSTFEFDEGYSSEYLFRAGLLSQTLGKEKEAIEYFKTIKEKFPKSEKAGQIDKYINRLQLQDNNLSAE